MAIYICPSDVKYSCSWEGAAEDVIDHFEQEHDDLLYFDNSFNIDLLTASENRLFVVDEEVYLAQTKILENLLVIKLRYLGPQRLANEICYNVFLKINEQFCDPQCLIVTPEGSIEIDLQKLESLYPQLQKLNCTLNITKNFNNINDEDENTIVNEIIEIPEPKASFTVTDAPSSNILTETTKEALTIVTDDSSLGSEDSAIEVSTELTNAASPVSEDAFKETELEQNDNSVISRSSVTITRSKTTSFDEAKRTNIKRNKSSLSLGPISENDSSVCCSDCGGILKPPIYVCPCDQNFCAKCLNSICKFCQEKVTYERNLELEENYNKVLHPCKYKRLGCPQKLFYNDLHQHEVNCSFCEYKCPMDECHFEGQYKGLCKHLKLIHGSTKILESCIVVFQNVPEAFLVNEEKGIFYCYVKYGSNSVLWEAKFCGPKERNFFCELKFKDGKLKQPVLLKKIDNTYSVEMSFDDLKRLKLKSKNAILTITS